MSHSSLSHSNLSHSNFSYRTVTEDIEVLVTPEFSVDQSSPEKGNFFWTYTVEIRNRSRRAVQLRTRHWKIVDAAHGIQNIHGVGVVGEKPIIRPGMSFRYTSGCPLKSSQGIMLGSFTMMTEDGTRLKVEIPAFPLDTPGEKRVLH